MVKMPLKRFTGRYPANCGICELAGVDSLYDLDVSSASQLITNGNGRK